MTLLFFLGPSGEPGFVRSFEGVSPLARYDGLPFTTAVIFESVSKNGAYLVIDSITLDPVDSDPALPEPRSFTTSLATHNPGWYVIRWQDGQGSTYDSEPIFSDRGESVPAEAVAWQAARALEPVAWDALRAYPDYGDSELQRVIDLAKLRVLPAAFASVAESDLDARVIDYVAKKALVDNVLSAAISFWTNQTISQNARGNTDEVVTYPDRIKAASDAIVRYRADLDRQLQEIEAILGGVAEQYDAPAIDQLGPLLTPGLDEYRALPVTTQHYWRPTR